LNVVLIELRVLAAVRYLTSRKYADASEVTVADAADRRTETGHTEQGHEIWSLLNYHRCGATAIYCFCPRIDLCR
jgi:hypothetical protein